LIFSHQKISRNGRQPDGEWGAEEAAGEVESAKFSLTPGEKFDLMLVNDPDGIQVRYIIFCFIF
jgi:hypothetical protein